MDTAGVEPAFWAATISGHLRQPFRLVSGIGTVRDSNSHIRAMKRMLPITSTVPLSGGEAPTRRVGHDYLHDAFVTVQ